MFTIYSITNKINQNRLIGQTKQKAKIRWGQHRGLLRNGKHVNSHMQNAWNKYGEESFIFEVLEETDSSVNLDNLEKEYCLKFSPNIYNILPGGEYNSYCLPDKTRKLMSVLAKSRWENNPKLREEKSKLMKKRKYPTIISPDGTEYNIGMFKLFCRTYNLDPGAMNRLLSNKVKSHKGWFLKGDKYAGNFNKLRSRVKRPNGYPQIKSPNGNVYTIETLSSFAKKHNMNIASLHSLVNKKWKQYKGWTVL